MKAAGEEIKTYAMDHHGLVAAVCADIKLSEKINARLGKSDPRRLVSPGKAVIAMILNGLGFTNRRLYLTPQFFSSKPVQQLLGEDMTADQLNDNTLGKALDEISSYGSSQLFGEIAFEVALENNLLGNLAHLDSSSLSVKGEYANREEEGVVKLTYGHSKDHRPDLKQVVMSLVVSGPGSIPIWMEPQDGNSSDRNTFHETIKKVRAFQSELQAPSDFRWIADSALYSGDKLLKNNDYKWISRVPETLSQAQALVEKDEKEVDWLERSYGYKTASFKSSYGGITQRWLLVYSEKCYQRERKTLMKKIDQHAKQLEKLLWHLGNERFSCEADADKAVKTRLNQLPYHQVDVEIVPIKKHARKGRPKKGEKGGTIGYRIECRYHLDKEKVARMLNRKGRFILATNDLDNEALPDKKLLEAYKSQQCVERGFRFLKDPWFMVDSIFLKSPRRIEALMMVMTLCLMIYNIGQYRLRNELAVRQITLPNQINQPIQNPTLRWIFQIMEGIGVVRFYQKSIHEPIYELVTNLNELRRRIIRLFGETAQKIYGII